MRALVKLLRNQQVKLLEQVKPLVKSASEIISEIISEIDQVHC